MKKRITPPAARIINDILRTLGFSKEKPLLLYEDWNNYSFDAPEKGITIGLWEESYKWNESHDYIARKIWPTKWTVTIKTDQLIEITLYDEHPTEEEYHTDPDWKYLCSYQWDLDDLLVFVLITKTQSISLFSTFNGKGTITKHIYDETKVQYLAQYTYNNGHRIRKAFTSIKKAKAFITEHHNMEFDELPNYIF